LLVVSKIKLKILGLSSSQSQSGSFALVLGEQNGTRRLPITIGMFEAQAIAIEIEKITPHRPMTHDLFKSFAKAFDYVVHEIFISELREGVFFAKIICSGGVEIDSRPSDAIAIGIRFNVPIYTNENIMSEAGIVLFDIGEEEESEEEETHQEADTVKSQPLERLQQLLEEALENEDYEQAARLRDEINRRN
jgi:uncharacterized protein